MRMLPKSNNRSVINLLFCLSLFIILTACTGNDEDTQQDDTLEPPSLMPVIFDTDANNELDDQHALAYLLFSEKVFDVRGITVNATFNGGDIEQQYDEAERVMKLCMVDGKIPLFNGSNDDFESIRGSIYDSIYDGSDAVEFIITESRMPRDQKLILLPVGKLTNIALALLKAPDIADMVRVVWLGSNYPDPGEYNLINDIPAMNYILETDVPFEMVMVRYGKSTGSDAVRVTREEMEQRMPGLGPNSMTVTGRHGGSFNNFGDYSVDLFRHATMHGTPPSRALFDMVSVAVVKKPSWGTKKEIPAPIMRDSSWVDQPNNPRKISIWENFNKQAILDDFFGQMKQPDL